MPLITLSRKYGAGGEAVARTVSRMLNVALYDDQRLQEEALKRGLSTEALNHYDEKAPAFFDRLWRSQANVYLDMMASVVFDVARSGSGVIVGHGSALLLEDFDCAFHVLICASEASRIKTLATRYGISPKGASKLIRQRDQAYQGFTKFAYHMDWDDPSQFDLVINTEKLGPEGAANLIVETAGSDALAACDLGALQAMERRSLIKRIQAALRMNGFNLTSLTIDADHDGNAYVSGLMEAKRLQRRLIDVVKGVPGVRDVRPDLSYMIKL